MRVFLQRKAEKNSHFLFIQKISLTLQTERMSMCKTNLNSFCDDNKAKVTKLEEF